MYWRSIAFPVEHGGWGLLAEPILLGFVVAPSRAGLALAAGGGFALAAGAVFAFLARHPLRLVLLDRRKATRHPRTIVAERWLACYVGLAVASLVLALSLTPAFWPALAVALPPGLVALHFDARGRSREAVAEIAGACTLSTSSSAIALAGGAPTGLAFGASALLAMRAVATIQYVRARIRQDRGLPAGSGQALHGHVAALVGAVFLFALGWGPLTAVPAFDVLLARAAWGLSKRRRVLRPRSLGYQEMGFGLLTLVLLALGYRLRAGRLPWL